MLWGVREVGFYFFDPHRVMCTQLGSRFQLPSFKPVILLDIDNLHQHLRLFQTQIKSLSDSFASQFQIHFRINY